MAAGAVDFIFRPKRESERLKEPRRANDNRSLQLHQVNFPTDGLLFLLLLTLRPLFFPSENCHPKGKDETGDRITEPQRRRHTHNTLTVGTIFSTEKRPDESIGTQQQGVHRFDLNLSNIPSIDLTLSRLYLHLSKLIDIVLNYCGPKLNLT